MESLSRTGPLLAVTALTLLTGCSDGCRRTAAADASEAGTALPTEPIESAPEPTGAPCAAIEAASYVALPRSIGGNQFDPSGVAVVGPVAYLVNDREGRDGPAPGGNGLVRLDLATGAVSHVPVDGFDDRSRKLEGIAYDGHELHVTGNIGGRRDNTLLVSVPVDAGSGEVTGAARHHDSAAGMGAATGLGDEPWDHGLKVEALAATGPGTLLMGLRATGDGVAARAYTMDLSPAGQPPAPLTLRPDAVLDDLDLGIAAGGPDGGWRQPRGLSGLSEPAAGAIVGVAAAEYDHAGDDAFLANALLMVWPATGRAEVLCTFDEGRKAEGVVFTADADVSPGAAMTGTLLVVYDNDGKAAGGYRIVGDVSLPGSPDGH